MKKNIYVDILIEDIDDIIVEIKDDDYNDEIYNISTSLSLLNRIKTLNYHYNIIEINIDSNIDFKDDYKIVNLIKEIIDNENVKIYYD